MKTRLLITALLGFLFAVPVVADGESTAGETVGAFGESNESTAWRIICRPWRLDSGVQAGIATLRAAKLVRRL